MKNNNNKSLSAVQRCTYGRSDGQICTKNVQKSRKNCLSERRARELWSNSLNAAKCGRECLSVVCCFQFNLVCGWNFLVPFASTMFMAGVLVCAVSSGIFSDK